MKRGQELSPFIVHTRSCAVCRAFPRDPCTEGKRLFNEGAYTLARRIDPRRAKA